MVIFIGYIRGKNVNRILVGSIMFFMLFIPSVNVYGVSTPSYHDQTFFLNKNIVQSGDILIKKHILPLVKEYFFIKENRIKNIIKNIIIEILKTEDATIDEIREIIDLNGVSVKDIYLFADIKTSKLTDGYIQYYPGEFRSMFNVPLWGSYVRYRPHSGLVLYDWNLQINGNDAERRAGYVFGYYGHATSVYEWYPPGEYYSFTLDGSAILTFHGS